VPNLASSFAKQPLAGLLPPSNLSFAFCRQSANFAGSSPPGGLLVLAVTLQERHSFFETQSFLAEAQALRVACAGLGVIKD
jgi:hypothetical protein